ncbi:UxaA family hydrolase [Alicyclobacillus cycloheptanicus]|uniref:Altronate dehydratase n=1 Tax=Alicyclobacillus cycloheptanicus TaxID=1457 RepID=A0ABT9XGT0_9BACL|nr:UxaA family hydrolase [Alicyclobacillus cycloheptanicus]MDQ0189520.1 altronate dehydratase [Alicyclobacillus cycloheptanicus]WDM01581.1 UxaA family hydrolase [Alicyclobacillus cycloheptanicus]
MTGLTAYRRSDGGIGVRNYLFTLPTVVCANQVVVDVALTHPELKYIEHQHGCAQIGADLEQTRRIFTQLALHPNVYASMFVSLGCEGVVATKLFANAAAQTDRPMDLVVIQASGGTPGAEARVDAWIDQRQRELDRCQRETAGWDELVVGVLIDSSVASKLELVRACLESLQELGVRIVIPNAYLHLAEELAGAVGTVDYGESADERVWAMKPGSNALETTTGLTAAGAHLIVHLADRPHAFGSPLAPTIRWCMDETTYQKFRDDFDGQLQSVHDVQQVTEQLASIANGHPTVAESFGMDDFALYRIGPTV